MESDLVGVATEDRRCLDEMLVRLEFTETRTEMVADGELALRIFKKLE